LITRTKVFQRNFKRMIAQDASWRCSSCATSNVESTIPNVSLPRPCWISCDDRVRYGVPFQAGSVRLASIRNDTLPGALGGGQIRAPRWRFTVSRQDELLRLADLFHSQANLMRSRAAKQSLRKIGDYYQHEAEHLRRQASSDSDTEQPRAKHILRYRESAA
jgi:hypothetical protein